MGGVRMFRMPPAVSRDSDSAEEFYGVRACRALLRSQPAQQALRYRPLPLVNLLGVDDCSPDLIDGSVVGGAGSHGAGRPPSATWHRRLTVFLDEYAFATYPRRGLNLRLSFSMHVLD
ncbi:hypothetical protein AMK26_20105 [Streptomyces sp. CB03234]|nr:hypothetical protein AMK26_20105 [Streptomyces sp. CB03234]